MRRRTAYHETRYRLYETDGVRHLGRKSITKLNLCLYLDRCTDALDVQLVGELRTLRPIGTDGD